MSNSWTDLNISDSLKQACADVSAKTKDDFASFVKDALERFGVDSVNSLKPTQRKTLDEHIQLHWTGTYTGEEAQRLDELSKTTLKSYSKKSKEDIFRRAKTERDLERDGIEHGRLQTQHAGYRDRDKDPVSKSIHDKLEKNRNKIVNRSRGIDKAVDKLAEAATPAEIEANTLASKTSMPALQRRLQTALDSHDIQRANIAKLAIKAKKELAEQIARDSVQLPSYKGSVYDAIHDIVNEGKNSEGRTDLTDALDTDKRKEDLKDAKVDLQKDHNIANQIKVDEEQPGAKISKITADNAKPVEGKVTKEPGVETEAQKTLSPGEAEKVKAAAAKLGLKEAKLEHPVDIAYAAFRKHRDSHDGSKAAVAKETALYNHYKKLEQEHSKK